MTWEQRWHPFREEWGIVAAYWHNRPRALPAWFATHPGRRWRFEIPCRAGDRWR